MAGATTAVAPVASKTRSMGPVFFGSARMGVVLVDTYVMPPSRRCLSLNEPSGPVAMT